MCLFVCLFVHWLVTGFVSDLVVWSVSSFGGDLVRFNQREKILKEEKKEKEKREGERRERANLNISYFHAIRN